MTKNNLVESSKFVWIMVEVWTDSRQVVSVIAAVRHRKVWMIAALTKYLSVDISFEIGSTAICEVDTRERKPAGPRHTATANQIISRYNNGDWSIR